MFGFTEIIRKTYSGDVKIAIEIEIPRHRLLPGSAAAQTVNTRITITKAVVTLVFFLI